MSLSAKERRKCLELRDRLACGHRTNRSSFRRRSHVQGAECRRDLRLFVFVGFPTRRQRTLMKPHTCHFFFFIGFPTAANKRATCCIQSSERLFQRVEPVPAARPSKEPFSCESLASKKKISRKTKCAQTDHKLGVQGYLREE